MSEFSSKNTNVPTYQQLQQSGKLLQWLQWSEDDWKNVPETVPNEEDYMALQIGTLFQNDQATLFREAEAGNLFAMMQSLVSLQQQGNQKLFEQYVQKLLQARFYCLLSLLVEHEDLQSIFHITLPKAKALELIMQDAPTRHPFEQFMIGSSMLAGNNGFEKDMEQGIYYLTLSARRGCMRAMSWMGAAYANGTGVERDILFAIRCFEMMYERKFPDAALPLGVNYLNLGTEEQMRQATAVCMPYVIYEYYPTNENVEKGLRLLREAKDAGNEEAARILEQRETNPPHCMMAIMYQQMTGLPIEFNDK